jgi:tetratricopeptide (TPR) repeat protein
MIRLLPPLLLLQATTVFAGGPYISFTRIVPASHDLAPAQTIAVIYAIGDNQNVTTFVEDFVDYVERARTLRIENAVENNKNLASFDGADFKRLRRQHPADAYIGINVFTCTSTQRSAQGSERALDGSRVQRLHVWLDAACEARLDIRNDRGRHLMTLTARGEGTSPRSSELSAEERDVAFEQAARYAALNAADMITPRVVRETIELDDTAPAFDQGLSMIQVDRLEDARTIWEVALRGNRNSAALNFDLGAVCEATGDAAAARKYFQAAVRLSPDERRYRQELELLQRRNVRK